MSVIPSPGSWTAAVAAALIMAVALLLNPRYHSCGAVELEVDDYNLCLVTQTQFEDFMKCMFVDSETSEDFKKATGDILNKFPGLSIWEIANIICKANGDRGDEVLDEFLGSFPEALSNEITGLLNVCLPRAKAID